MMIDIEEILKTGEVKYWRATYSYFGHEVVNKRGAAEKVHHCQKNYYLENLQHLV